MNLSVVPNPRSGSLYTFLSETIWNRVRNIYQKAQRTRRREEIAQHKRRLELIFTDCFLGLKIRKDNSGLPDYEL